MNKMKCGIKTNQCKDTARTFSHITMTDLDYTTLEM